MISILYSTVLFFYALCILPKFLWQRIVLGKYRETIAQRFGFHLPQLNLNAGQKVLWIHAVSMGETRAVIPLCQLLAKQFPEMAIVISSTTETGYAEAKRSMPEANAHFFLPLDFSWIIQRTLNHFKPSYLILVEGDVWYHLLSLAKKLGLKIFYVNGKISERSAKRFSYISSFARRLYSYFDVLCVQSELYASRFRSLGIPSDQLIVTGNMKLDASPKRLTDVELDHIRSELGIKATDRLLVIGSTHEPEEEWLLSALDSVWKRIPTLKVVIVPRHPERFAHVTAMLRKRGVETISYSQRQQKTGAEQVILIDAMGLLNTCYQLADIAIVAGTFVSHVGGHNLFEPTLFHVPVLFGPHVHNQPNLQQLILEAKAGKQVTLEEVPQAVLDLLTHPEVHAKYVKACKTLCLSVQGSVKRTYDSILPYLLR